MSGGVRAGELNELVEIRPMKLTQDSSGQEVKSFPVDLYLKTWTKVMPISGLEKFKSGREMSSITYQFKVRYIPTLKITDTLVYGDQCFDIVSINPGGTHLREYMILMGEILED